MLKVKRSWRRKLSVRAFLFPTQFYQQSIETSQLYPGPYHCQWEVLALFLWTENSRVFRNPNSTEVAIWVWNFCVSVSVLSHSGLHHQHRTLINIQFSVLFEVSQLASAAYSTSGKASQKVSQKLQEVANVTISKYTRGHSPPDPLHRGTSKSKKPLPDPCKLFLQKLGLDYHCAVSAAAHPTFISITESMDCKIPQQIITGDSKTLKTKLVSTKSRRMLCKFWGVLWSSGFAWIFFNVLKKKKTHMFIKFINYLLFSRYLVESFTFNAGRGLANSRI